MLWLRLKIVSMRDDTLSLNDDKIEFLIIGTELQLSKMSVVKIKVDQALILSNFYRKSAI